MAYIPDSFRTDILGEELDTKKVLFENANKPTVTFALGFTIDTDASEEKFWFYNCTATRPSVNASTNEDTKTPQTDTVTISCAPNSDGLVRSRTTAETDTETKAAWYTKVYVKAEA